MARYATIDVGTNSVLLLVAEAAGKTFKPIADRAEITRLGRGVDKSGVLEAQSMADTLAVVKRYVEEAKSLGASEILCTATSAARDARNGRDFLDQVKAQTGVTVEIISGDLEAELSYASAHREFGDEPLVVLDIGGGSSEFVFGSAGKVSYKKSFDVGSVRLTERHVSHDPPTLEERLAMQRYLDTVFGELPPTPVGARLVGVAGTVTTLAAVAHSVDPYDPVKIHGSRLTASEVRSETGRLFALSVVDRRRLPGLQPKRADVIPAGALILERAMARLGVEEVTVSDRGIRWGLLYQRFGGA